MTPELLIDQTLSADQELLVRAKQATQACQTPDGQFPHRLNPAQYAERAAAQSALTHLGIVDPVTALMVSDQPDLELTPFSLGDLKFGVIGAVLIFDRGRGLQRSEHDPTLVKQLIETLDKLYENMHGFISEEVTDLIEQLWNDFQSFEITEQYPELRHVPESQQAALLKGGLRSGAAYRAILPGATPEIRRDLGRLFEYSFSAASPWELSGAIRGLRLLIQAGELRHCQAFTEAFLAGRHWITQNHHLAYAVRSGNWLTADGELLRDAIGNTEQLLSRLDLALLDVSCVRPDMNAVTLHDLLIDLSSEVTSLSSKIGPSVTLLAPVPPEREGQVSSPELTFLFTAAATSKDLQAEGRELSHCVGGYFYTEDAAKGRCQIYRIQTVTDTGPHSTLTAEIQGNRLHQLRGKHNRDATPQEESLVRTWLDRNGIQHAISETASGTWGPHPDPQAARLAAAEKLNATQEELELGAAAAALGLTEAQARDREASNRRVLQELKRELQRRRGTRPINAARLPLRGHPWEAQIGGQWYLQGQTVQRTITLSVRNGTAKVTTHVTELSEGEVVTLDVRQYHNTFCSHQFHQLIPEARAAWEDLFSGDGPRVSLPTTAHIIVAAAAHPDCERQLTVADHVNPRQFISQGESFGDCNLSARGFVKATAGFTEEQFGQLLELLTDFTAHKGLITPIYPARLFVACLPAYVAGKLGSGLTLVKALKTAYRKQRAAETALQATQTSRAI